MRCLNACAVLMLTTAACAHVPRSGRVCDSERDAAAIRGIAGTFAAQFAFDEVEPFADGYSAHAPYRATAREVVTIVEDTGTRVVLQHLLMHDKDGALSVLKHWREDWTYEAKDVLVFSGHSRWRHVRPSDLERRCAWSQAVYEVDDRPRYAALGVWTHAPDGSTWTSGETWRPLPRREYTKRSDYDVLIGVNTITVDARGWTHGQDNLKWVSATSRTLAHEKGDTRYERQDDPQAAKALAEWSSESAAWAIVRAAWDRAFVQRELTVLQKVNEAPLYEKLFPLIEELASAAPAVMQERIEAVIAPYIAP